MTLLKKSLAFLAGSLALLAALGTTSNLTAQSPPSQADLQPLQLDEDVQLDWIEKSNVAALRQGVVNEMELSIGDDVKKGGLIGSLHSEMADLTLKKAQIVAKSVGPLLKAKAQKSLALAVVAINKRLNDRIPGSVSFEEQEKAKAELNVAEAMTVEAGEKIEQDKAEVSIAERTLEEHKIVAPFDGKVTEVHKHPGESVQANEPVVTICNLDRIRAWTYIPVEFAYRVKPGQIVEIEPKLAAFGADTAGHQKVYRGKITFVDDEIQPVGEAAVRVYAEIDNKDHMLKKGLKASMRIFLTKSDGPVESARTSRAAVGR